MVANVSNAMGSGELPKHIFLRLKKNSNGKNKNTGTEMDVIHMRGILSNIGQKKRNCKSPITAGCWVDGY